ncbi:MAG: hypothetical protein ACOCRX_00660 [Candidatus Woesearchaeota archaeon]
MGLEWLDFNILDRVKGQEFVSISTKSGSNKIYISAALIRRYLGKETKYARFGIDYDERLLYIKPMTPHDSKAIRLARASSLAESKYINHNNLVGKIKGIAQQPKNTNIRYKAEWDTTLQALRVHLAQPISNI